VTEEQFQEFLRRIDALTLAHKPKFGQMNVHQMVCHCTDQLRLAFGTIIPDEDYLKIDPREVKELALAKKTVPTPKGIGQTEGGGTQPTTFDNDLALLKTNLSDFINIPEDFEYAPHPYFGAFDKRRWTSLTVYHLNHHLSQFNV